MRGFKAFDKDLKCRGLQYTIGCEMSFDGNPIVCKQGFHFCRTIADTYNYYPMDDSTRICEVEATGDVVTDDDKKYCTNKIVIIREITSEVEKHCNTDGSTTGYCNTGNRNTGNRNTGDWNTGDWNTGNFNTGDWNTGNFNTGNCNTGNRNTGYCNTGDWNTGNRNTGYCNTGNWNTGDWNVCDRSSGIFGTKTGAITFFDKPSDWTYDNWFYSKTREILNDIPSLVVEWIDESRMSDKEKRINNTYVYTGGYLKVKDKTSARQEWWDALPESDKREIMSLPNFDSEKFKKCTGIEVIEE